MNQRPYRFVFIVRFETEEALRAYIPIWEESSRFIQQEVGARGTRLHRLQGEIAVLAIAEWESQEARNRAMESLTAKYPEDHISRVDDATLGEFIVVGRADEIATIFPETMK